MANIARALLGIALAVLVSACGESGNVRTGPAEFYRGKTITIVVGYNPGGGYDIAARSVARYLGNHIPGNPRVIVQNMPGAGTLTAANHVYNSAPRDGTVLALLADAVPIMPLLKFPGALFDPRQVSYIGALGERDPPLVFVRSDAPATTYEEATRKVNALGGTGGDNTSIYPVLLNALVGTKFKLVNGYRGTEEIMLAMESGELHGRAGLSWKVLKMQKPEWIERKFITVILQMGLKPDPELPGVPLAIDFVRSDDDRALMRLMLGTTNFAYTISAPPDVPPDRLAALRTGLKATLEDKALLAELKKVTTEDINYRKPEDIEAFLRDAYALPKRIIDRAASFMNPGVKP